MFIVWGKKPVYRTLGYVADFCPICRKPQPFLLQRVGMAGHLYYISVGDGELVGFQRTCQECKTFFPAEPDSYKTISKELASLDTLTTETFPNLAQVWAERLAVEERVRHAPALIPAQERKALIQSPFLLLSPRVERRFASTHVDKEIGRAMLAALGLIIIGPGIMQAIAPDQSHFLMLAIGLASLGWIGWRFATAHQRFLQREIAPVLAKALKPLRPTSAELAGVFAELKLLKHKIAEKLKLVDLEASLQSPSPSV
jgi:hypothetical protein